jgi:hypothetical protein
MLTFASQEEKAIRPQAERSLGVTAQFVRGAPVLMALPNISQDAAQLDQTQFQRALRDQIQYAPPLTKITWPWTIAADGLARNSICCLKQHR